MADTIEENNTSTTNRKMRTEMLKRVSSNRFQDPSDELFWHGRLFKAEACGQELERPRTKWASKHKPRRDHDAPDWLTASEFVDHESTIEKKLDALARLLLLSQKTVVYSGAGISVAAGIGQAAAGSGGAGVRKRFLTTTAMPTYTHHALAAMAKEGLIHGWVQQNHDGLPQKAGFPQERINEIHGAWYDPSNPVVLYSGNLRTYEYNWMVDEAETADLVLVLGTSLSGLNADQVAISAAGRSRSSQKRKSLGMVMINLQQTAHDGKSTLNIFGTTDDVFKRLLPKLGISEPDAVTTHDDDMETDETNSKADKNSERKRKVLVPYDIHGKRTKNKKMWLDLTPGQSIKIVGHNIQGAKQPTHRHIKAKQPVGTVKRWNSKTMGIDLRVQGVTFTLGYWWVDAAEQGQTPTIPVVNENPIFVSNANNKVGGKGV